MYWRWEDQTGKRSDRAYATQEEAQTEAVLVGANITRAMYDQKPEENQKILWKLLERAGWHIWFAP